MLNLLKTTIRHLIGVGAGAATTAIGSAVIPGLGTTDPDETFATLLTALFVAGYAIAEKALKPLWKNWLGEEG